MHKTQTRGDKTRFDLLIGLKLVKIFNILWLLHKTVIMIQSSQFFSQPKLTEAVRSYGDFFFV